jgi:hypothetical protein
VKDFQEYWAVRLPPEAELCAFPQAEKELASMMTIETNLKSVSWNRLAFILVPRKEGKAPRPLPAPFEIKKPLTWAETRVPANETTHQAFEWSVGFLID